MPNLVADAFCRRLWIAIGDVVFENETRRVTIPCERRQIRHATSRCPKPIAVAPSDGNPYAPAGVGATAIAKVFEARFLSRYVDVERCKILDDTGPDVLNIAEFRVGESCHVVDAVFRCDDRGLAVGGIPRRSGRRVPVEIEVNDLCCRWPTVQQERLREFCRT